MDITFYGAAREVTGSMHLVRDGSDYILLDCGLFQGRRKESEEKNRVLPFNPRIITNIVLSHAHIDHSGRIPLMTRKGFGGRIISSRATADACAYLLPDSAHIQESDANYLNYKRLRSTLTQIQSDADKRRSSKRLIKEIKKILKKGRHELDIEKINELSEKYHIEQIRPLYSTDDAFNALKYFDGYPVRTPVTIGKDTTVTFYEAGHILGSTICIIKSRKNGNPRTICYTGDLGRFEKPLLRNPCLNFLEEDRDIDLLIIESTYGNRFHDPVSKLSENLKNILITTFDRGGTVLIPSFAFGRTQEIIYALHELYNTGNVPRMPIYVDSPLAVNLTRVFGEHLELFDQDTHKTFLEFGKNPFLLDEIEFISEVEDSIALNKETKPHIVIASSGMCEAGRILHHLRYKIHNGNNTILIVGYMAENTLGRRILEQGLAYQENGRKGDPPLLKFFNKNYPLKAHVEKLDGFSAHGDKNELVRFVREANLNIRNVAVVHGEEEQAVSFADTLKEEGYPTVVPQMGESVHIA